ncbi:alpha/beta hydrolase [Pseudonocardia zijingensis]|jgi:pimeloyl-ACP methyl ester carboxylesterase|uniref:Alpha/beta hydrolase n=1 Tax=Pseudonocardia zijingensis TaxID=153376 RepID=A0ABP3ZH09_9PSEU
MDITTTDAIERLGPPQEPGLPPGFTDTFESLLVRTPRLRHHAVVGGRGPALLLINGWPQTWYAWRHVLPALARQHTVVAVEPRGSGRSDKPAAGYDTGSLAADLAAVMERLGHHEYAVIGHDVGMWIGFALAADHPERVTRLAVAEAAIPGVSADPAFFGPAGANERLFHFGFNRLGGLNEELVRGREALYFGHQFATKAAAGRPLERHAVDVYVAALAAGPDALRASFEPYRAIDETVRQNTARRATRLPVPVLAVGGSESLGAAVGATMAAVADDVTPRVLDGCGHFPAEEAPEEFLGELLPFLRRPL